MENALTTQAVSKVRAYELMSEAVQEEVTVRIGAESS